MAIIHFHCLLLLLLLTAQTRAAQDDDKGSDSSNGRTTLDIVWSCLATIFACTWLAVHPNVPNRHMREKGRLFLAMHRVKHMLLAIICPEAVVMWAFRQRLVASMLSKRPVEPSSPDWELSMTHSFFISMGGFIGKDERAITFADFYNGPGDTLEGVIARGIRSDLDISPILRIPKEELMDKSKGDALSKSISLLQTIWFVVQYFSRITLSLPTTPLETATLAFALLNFCNYILWWHKPLDVQHPLNFPTFETKGWECSGFSNSTSIPSLQSESLIPSTQLPTSTVPESQNSIPGAAASMSDLSGYAYYQPSSPSSTSTSKHQLSVDRVKTHASESVCCNECLECDISNPFAIIIAGANFSRIMKANTTLPMLWAGRLSWNQTRYIAYFGGCVGASFGGIHYIGRTSLGSCDSSLEQLLWKFSSLSIAIIPVILASELLFFQCSRWVTLFMQYSTRIFTFIYICARVYLVVDMFVSLRSLPPGALEEIDWTRYIPHI
ncbi:hypothetical protein IW261DRAFT_1343509 [Armillaria novae-zelandiae]|uniref:Uncharacterized protein n=1 Tax=Armillaria novae-zelandiae TaxID=153914 RepID=A0AA39NV92_9AGAR|nr:hypothetical protein IW261DRAFT_1343509 [Armillaria novae-zelandiae]